MIDPKGLSPSHVGQWLQVQCVRPLEGWTDDETLPSIESR